MEPLILDKQPLTIADVVAVARRGQPVQLGVAATQAMRDSRQLVERIVAGSDAVYGINTGFGHLSRVRIAPTQTTELQRNLVRSHAAGVGAPLEEDATRALMLLVAASLARGYSGARPIVAETICALLNAHITPVIPSRGSVGASGDLAPLAHLALALTGEGKRIENAELRMQKDSANTSQFCILNSQFQPLTLEAKEGLALLNGTHLMAGMGALLLHDATTLLDSAITAAAMSVDAARGSHTPFDARIHAARPHHGQVAVAARLRELLQESEIAASHRDCPRVQDPYSLRCIPQVLGAVSDALAFARTTLATELGAVTDNPLCFATDGAVLSGGNFHGQPLALALDTLAIALCHLAAFAERRVFLLVAASDPEMHLPPFLCADAGVRSGLMIAQYTAAALVNECQTLAVPASTMSIPTSAGMEDFNSMGATSAHKCWQLIVHARRVVAIELLCAAQALEFQRPLRPGIGVEQAHRRVRAVVPPLDTDRVLSDDIAAVESLLINEAFGAEHIVL